MSNNYKAVVFFDLDGTLLNETSTLDQEVIDAVQQLKKNNVLPVICTGRSDGEILDIIEQTGITSTITLNGHRITLEGKELYYHRMNKDDVNRFMETTQKNNHNVAFYTPTEIHITGVDRVARECFDIINAPIPDIQPDFYKTHDIPMMLIFTEQSEMDTTYRNEFPEFEFYRNGPKAMDIVARGQSKGNAIKILIDALNLNDITTYAFGDGTNDFSMFEAVDRPIAMGNAVDALKEQAFYITTKNIDHGIVNGLKHFDLI